MDTPPEGMPIPSDRRVRRLPWLLTGVCLGLLFGCCVPYPKFFLWTETTLQSLSPDDETRVRLIDTHGYIDRNFELWIEHPLHTSPRKVFRSPDEGRPEGSERIVWSPDSQRFVLLGRHFYTVDEAKLPNGEQLYLMMDVSTGQIWCNATQQSRYPNFALADAPWLKP